MLRVSLTDDGSSSSSTGKLLAASKRVSSFLAIAPLLNALISFLQNRRRLSLARISSRYPFNQISRNYTNGSVGVRAALHRGSYTERLSRWYMAIYGTLTRPACSQRGHHADTEPYARPTVKLLEGGIFASGSFDAFHPAARVQKERSTRRLMHPAKSFSMVFFSLPRSAFSMLKRI